MLQFLIHSQYVSSPAVCNEMGKKGERIESRGEKRKRTNAFSSFPFFFHSSPSANPSSLLQMKRFFSPAGGEIDLLPPALVEQTMPRFLPFPSLFPEQFLTARPSAGLGEWSFLIFSSILQGVIFFFRLSGAEAEKRGEILSATFLPSSRTCSYGPLLPPFPSFTSP